jgi:hypothetical protein
VGGSKFHGLGRIAPIGDRLEFRRAPFSSSYSLQRDTDSAGNQSLSATPTIDSHTDSTVTNTATYNYNGSASNGSCTSGDSAEASATPL